MAGFVKLDVGILNSTLWAERDCRDVFLTALLMAHPYELRNPAPQLEVDSLRPTGFEVPPGWYGFVPAAGIGIIRQSMIDDQARGLEALRVLGSPEASSRSPDFEGRRLVRVDGGYIVLNFMKYRERDYTASERMKRWRDRKQNNVTSRNECDVTRNVTQAEVRGQRSEAEHLSTAPAVAGRASRPGLTVSKRNGVSDDVSRPEDVSEEVWKDWVDHRKRKRGSVTARVIATTRRDAEAAGMTMEEALEHWVKQGYQGFFPPNSPRSGGKEPVMPKVFPKGYYSLKPGESNVQPL